MSTLVMAHTCNLLYFSILAISIQKEYVQRTHLETVCCGMDYSFPVLLRNVIIHYHPDKGTTEPCKMLHRDMI
jgi:hypothetical protein